MHQYGEEDSADSEAEGGSETQITMQDSQSYARLPKRLQQKKKKRLRALASHANVGQPHILYII